jgi:hypothetical protein
LLKFSAKAMSNASHDISIAYCAVPGSTQQHYMLQHLSPSKRMNLGSLALAVKVQDLYNM